MNVLRKAAEAAMRSKLARWMGGSRTHGGASPGNPYKQATKGYAAGGAVDMGSVGGGVAPTNLGRPGRGRPKGSKNKGKKKNGKGTNVNVVVMPKDSAPAPGGLPPGGMPPPVPPPPVIAPSPPPVLPGPMAGPGPMGPPPDAMGLGMGAGVPVGGGAPPMPLPPMRASGGRVGKDGGGAVSDRDRELSGSSDPNMPKKAHGGKVDLPKDQDEGGAGSGVGRLDKVKDSNVKPGKAVSA